MNLLGQKITSIEHRQGHTLWLRYRNGALLEVNLADLVERAQQFDHGPITDLANPDFFAQVKVSHRGGLEWPNGYDYCPDALYLRGLVRERAVSPEQEAA